MSKPTLSVAAKAIGLYVERIQVGECYSRNGNAHNPTPRYSFVARKGPGPAGVIGTYTKHGSAVELCNDYAEDPR